MAKLFPFTFIALLLLPVVPMAAQNFQREYSSNNEDIDLTNLVVLSNGQAVVAGSVFLQNLYPVLFALAPDGTVLWRKGLRINTNQSPQDFFSVFSMQPLPNGNALVLMPNLYTPLTPDLLSTRVIITEVSASNGNIVWQRYIGSENVQTLYRDAVVLADGILLSGYIKRQYSLAKINFSGDLIWQKNYAGAGTEKYVFNSVAVSPSGDIYATGLSSDLNVVSLSKFDETGEPLWSKSYALDEGSGPRIFANLDIALSADGQPVLWGTSAVLGPVDHQVFIMQVNPNDGDILVAQTITDPTRTFTTSDILALQGHTFLLCMGDGNSKEIAHYLKYDLEEGLIWSHMDDKTTLTGIVIKTALSPDGYFYSASFRASFTPESAKIITRTDQLLTNKPDCCHKNDPLVLEDQIFTVRDQVLTPAAQQWIETDAVFTWITPNIVTSLICGDNMTNVDFELSDTILCTGGCVSATSTGAGGAELIWAATGQPSVISSTGASFCFDAPGEYAIFATSVQDSCRRMARRVTVRDVAAPAIIQLDSMTCPGECVRFALDTVGADFQYTWTFQGGTPATFVGAEPGPVCYPQSGQFKVAVALAECQSQAEATVAVRYRNLLTPNAFTPNGDNINDRFQPLLKCPATDYHLTIYDRWGEKVFETRNPDDSWDGTINKKSGLADTYAWVLELADVRDAGANTEMLKGEVMLLR